MDDILFIKGMGSELMNPEELCVYFPVLKKEVEPMPALYIQPGDRKGEWFRVIRYFSAERSVECFGGTTCPLVDYLGRKAVFEVR